VDEIPGDPPITYWPAIITERFVESKAEVVQQNEPPTPVEIRTTQNFKWHASLLAAVDKVYVRGDEILPWLAYSPPPELFDIPLANNESVAFVFDRVCVQALVKLLYVSG
jgi:hypothetical protein